MLAIFPSPAGMPLTKLSLAGLIIPCQGEFRKWHPAGGLGPGISILFFYSVVGWHRGLLWRWGAARGGPVNIQAGIPMRSNPLQTRLHRFNPWPCALGCELVAFRVLCLYWLDCLASPLAAWLLVCGCLTACLNASYVDIYAQIGTQATSIRNHSILFFYLPFFSFVSGPPLSNYPSGIFFFLIIISSPQFLFLINQAPPYTVKKGFRFSRTPAGMSLTKLSPWPGIIDLFPPRDSLVSEDIPAGDGKIINLFYSVRSSHAPLSTLAWDQTPYPPPSPLPPGFFTQYPVVITLPSSN